MNPPILLASASPRRRELLHHLGYPFSTCSVDVDERPRPGEPAHELVARLALAKARAARFKNPHGVVIGCDTVVELEGEVLGKPAGPAEARTMLARLQGREHRVWTAAAVIAPKGEEGVEVSETRVRFRPMAGTEIDAYVATGEPLDKAGAYGIQERGAVFVEGVTGDYFTVVGLPLCRLGLMLARLIGPPPASGPASPA